MYLWNPSAKSEFQKFTNLTPVPSLIGRYFNSYETEEFRKSKSLNYTLVHFSTIKGWVVIIYKKIAHKICEN